MNLRPRHFQRREPGFSTPLARFRKFSEPSLRTSARSLRQRSITNCGSKQPSRSATAQFQMIAEKHHVQSPSHDQPAQLDFRHRKSGRLVGFQRPSVGQLRSRIPSELPRSLRVQLRADIRMPVRIPSRLECPALRAESLLRLKAPTNLHR